LGWCDDNEVADVLAETFVLGIEPMARLYPLAKVSETAMEREIIHSGEWRRGCWIIFRGKQPLSYEYYEFK